MAGFLDIYGAYIDDKYNIKNNFLKEIKEINQKIEEDDKKIKQFKENKILTREKTDPIYERLFLDALPYEFNEDLIGIMIDYIPIDRNGYGNPMRTYINKKKDIRFFLYYKNI